MLRERPLREAPLRFCYCFCRLCCCTENCAENVYKGCSSLLGWQKVILSCLPVSLMYRNQKAEFAVWGLFVKPATVCRETYSLRHWKMKGWMNKQVSLYSRSLFVSDFFILVPKQCDYINSYKLNALKCIYAYIYIYVYTFFFCVCEIMLNLSWISSFDLILGYDKFFGF